MCSSLPSTSYCRGVSASDGEVVIVAGGAGYIGSHVVLSLLKSGIKKILILDNFSNSKKDRLAEIVSAFDALIDDDNHHHAIESIKYVNIDLRSYDEVKKIFKEMAFCFSFTEEKVTIINLAGAKSVPESIQNPTLYYDNITISNNLLSCAKEFGIKKYIFSSSSTVYGQEADVPCKEADEIGKGGFTNPYAFSKFTIEKILEDYCKYDNTFSAISLRYFNPGGHFEAGNRFDGNDGDDSKRRSFLKDSPIKTDCKNVIPALVEAASSCSSSSHFKIFGVDFETKDGTAERDYVHVMDVADAHVLALFRLRSETSTSGRKYEAYNVGLGVPVSVKKLVETFQEVNSPIALKVVFEDRRPGDLACVYSDTSKIRSSLGWEPKRKLEDIVRI